MSATTVINTKKKYKKKSMGWNTFKRVFKTPSAKVGGVIFAVILIACIFAPMFAPYDAVKMDIKNMYSTPSSEHICGTDSLGRDIFSRLLYGGRYSLALGLSAALTSSIIGIILGSIAGYFGGFTESLIMRLTDMLSSIPGMLIAIIISASLGPGFVNTILAMSIGGIPIGVRMIRGQILAERSKEYLEAAESINCSTASIMFKHMLPNVISPMLVSTTMSIGITIIIAAGLSFLGLGIQPPTPEWGAMLSEGTKEIMNYPHMLLFPGLAIGLCVFSINLMGDGIRDALDPKLRN